MTLSLKCFTETESILFKFTNVFRKCVSLGKMEIQSQSVAEAALAFALTYTQKIIKEFRPNTCHSFVRLFYRDI